MILSFLTMYRSAKKSTFITFVASRFPTPPLLFAVGYVGDEHADAALYSPRSPDPASNAPKKVIKYAACFPTWPNFQGE